MTSQETIHPLVALFIDYENIVRSVNEHIGSPINWRIRATTPTPNKICWR